MIQKHKTIDENQQVLAPTPAPLRPLFKQKWCLDLLLLTIAFIGFYSLWLGSYPLFTPDEGRYSEVAREMVTTGDYITPRVNGVPFLDKPVLYYWLQAAAINYFGVQEWAIRLFPMLFGLLGCLMTYICTCRLFERRTAIIAAIITASTPLYFAAAHYANLDLEVAVLISCSLLCFLTGVPPQATSRTAFLYAAYVFAALAFLTKGLIGLAFPTIIIGSWILLCWRWDLLLNMRLPSGLALFALMVTPWYVCVQQANPAFLHFFFVTQQVTRFLSKAEFNNPSPWWFYIPIVLLGCFPWSIFLFTALKKSIQQIWQARDAHRNELFLLLWLSIVFCFFSIPKAKTISYILPVIPPIAILIANYINHCWQQNRRNVLYLSLASFCLISLTLSGLLFGLTQHNWIDFSASFTPYLRAMAVTMILAAATSVIIARKKSFPFALSLYASSSLICLLMLTAGAAHLNQASAKPIAMQLKTLLRPSDEVVNYYKFYQDIPMYLERRVTLVADWDSPEIPNKDNWVRELWYGMAFQDTHQWLINSAVFKQRWESPQRLFVFINANYFDRFKTDIKHYFYISKHNDIILVSNKVTNPYPTREKNE